MANRTNEQVAAQVAVEAVINNYEDYDATTVVAVLANGEAQGVADFYLAMLRDRRDADFS